MPEPVVVVVQRESPILNRAKLLRLAHSALATLEATPKGALDEATRARLARTWAGLITQLGSAVRADTLAELTRQLPELEGRPPAEGDLRLTQAQVVGWLNGLLLGEEWETWAAGVAGAGELASVLAERTEHGAE